MILKAQRASRKRVTLKQPCAKLSPCSTPSHELRFAHLAEEREGLRKEAAENCECRHGQALERWREWAIEETDDYHSPDAVLQRSISQDISAEYERANQAETKLAALTEVHERLLKRIEELETGQRG